MVKINASIHELTQIEGLINKKICVPVSKSKKKKEILDSMQDNEKYYFHTFIEEKDFKDLELPFLESQVQLKIVKAKIEYPTKTRQDNNNNFLPKKDRLNIIYIDVLFFTLKNKHYAVITTSNATNRNRILKLIGEENIKNSEDLKIDNDLFNWLMYVYEESKGKINNNIKLENISGFVGNVMDDTNVFSGNSEHTTELTVTKAFISNGGELSKVGIRIRHHEVVDISFFIDDNSNISIDYSSSEDLILLNTVKNYIGEEVFYILYIYCFLINELKRLYNIESQEFKDTSKKAYSKKIGLEVIKSIMLENEIKLHELT